jgi:molecular chaperone IbpA
MTNSTLVNAFLNRSIGWDNLFDDLVNRASINFPPYNIVKFEDGTTEIQLALAGYSKEDISVSFQESMLVISSSGIDKQDDGVYTHKGVAQRAFTTKFALGQHSEVQDVRMADGMLYISIVRVVPEEKKLKTFKIN